MILRYKIGYLRTSKKNGEGFLRNLLENHISGDEVLSISFPSYSPDSKKQNFYLFFLTKKNLRYIFIHLAKDKKISFIFSENEECDILGTVKKTSVDFWVLYSMLINDLDNCSDDNEIAVSVLRGVAHE